MDAETRRGLAILGIYLILGGALAAAYDATAAASQNLGTETDTCRALTMTQVVAQNAAGDVIFCIHSPASVPKSNSSWELGAYLASPQLTGSSPSLTLTLVIIGGCTALAPISFGTAGGAPAGSEQSRTWNVTMTSDACRGYVEGKTTSGGTVLFDAALAFNVHSDDIPKPILNSGHLEAKTSWDAWLPTLAAWLGWLAYTFATRFLRPQPLRIMADVIGYAVLTLPIGPEQFIALMVAQSGVAIFDLVQLITGKTDAP